MMTDIVANNVPAASISRTASEPGRSENINTDLREHQRRADDWDYKATVTDLHVWVERLISWFKLEIGLPALMIDRLRHAYGHFRYSRNGFGLKDEVAIDEKHLKENPYWCVLGTLFHELLHSWQQTNGKPSKWNYHNKELRQKAAGFGLIIDHRGYTQYQPGDTSFMLFLKEYGVTPPDLPEPIKASPRPGNSKLHLYECPCGVKARIGCSEFHAKCLNCEGIFELKR